MSNEVAVAEVFSAGSFLAVPEGGESAPVSGGVPYIAFRGSKTGNNKPEVRELLNSAGVKVGEFYLKDSIGAVPIVKFAYHVTPAVAVVAVRSDDAGGVIEARSGWNQGWADEGFQESVHAVVLFIAGATITPALVGLRGGLSGAIKPGIAALLQAKTPATWAARGQAFQVSSKFPLAPGRFVVTAWGTEEKVIGKARTYNKGSASVTPASPDEYARFAAHVGNPEFNAALGQAVVTHNRRVAATLSGENWVSED